MLKKIAITGPESTGKSALCKQLAEHYSDVWVPEAARDYLSKIDREYVESDILEIAKQQLKDEQEAALKAKSYLFCDTELIVTKIWSEHKYQRCDQWILDQINKADYDLYLLCDIDLPWEYDPMREHPDLRQHLFDLYIKELKESKIPFEIVSGNGDERLQNAIELIEKHN